MAAEDRAADDAQVAVNVFPHSDTVKVAYRTDAITIHRDAMTRLKKLYVIHGASGDPELGLLNDAIYCVLRRYMTLTDQTLGASFEAAAPRGLLRLLNNEWDVCFETFASPLNSFFRNYTSPFPDTDSNFGSMGSFFQFVPQQGSFLLHPSRVQEVLDRAASHLSHILTEQAGPLSFIVLAPDWEDPPLAGLAELDQSPFLRAKFTAEEKSHTFISGLEHIADGAWDTWRVVPHLGTRVYVLQNEAGAKVWSASPARISDLRECMGLGRLAEGENVIEGAEAQAEGEDTAETTEAAAASSPPAAKTAAADEEEALLGAADGTAGDEATVNDDEALLLGDDA